MTRPDTYVGIDNDINGGMTATAKIIRDAWVFGLIPETETCEGWRANQIEDLWRKVDAEWEKYGFLVGNLPEDTRDSFMRIHDAAMAHARENGWTGAQELIGDD